MNTVRRSIISIDENKCDGCGMCIPACEEGALQIIDGKARLVKDLYCDGLGNCLGECPMDAITLIEREAEPFDEKAVEEHLAKNKKELISEAECKSCSEISIEQNFSEPSKKKKDEAVNVNENRAMEAELSHWPVQMHLVSPEARFLQNKDLLISADCVPFACADFHSRFLAGHSLLIGCPKLDDIKSYHDKLVKIFKRNKLKSISLVYMEVGCCFGLSRLVHSALKEAEVDIPLKETIVGVDGSIKQ